MTWLLPYQPQYNSLLSSKVPATHRLWRVQILAVFLLIVLQVSHPINLVMMQLAYAVYQPPATFASCLQAMGVVPNSIRVVEANVPEYNTIRTAYVMLAGNQRIFVLVR
jgi:hypothetical protein